MKIGIMQPYFFPYIGYLSLIKNTDKFILLDEVQFRYHGWIERNRILKPSEGWQYIKVPLEKHSQKTLIKDIKIKEGEEWRELIVRQLEHYKKQAPYYDKVISLIKKSIYIETDSITVLNKNILKNICEYLNIKSEIIIFSEMNLSIDVPTCADEWALNICKAMGNVNEYWNPEGGITFFNKDKYINENIDIKFLKIYLNNYNQRRNNFEEGLSIIDVMMFNSTKEIIEMMDNYTFI